jgi:copper homeostasis protein
MTHSIGSKVLEVIVTSLEDAVEAQAGGADRLEVVRELALGGLTPDLALVRRIVDTVRIPVRVMLRETASMSLANLGELDILCRKAAEINVLLVDGIVAGFVSDGQVDLATLRAIAKAAPKMSITFHRAFDVLPDPLQAIRDLKTVPQVDRILTIGGSGSWPERQSRLHQWQHCAAPEIKLLAGAGLLEPVIRDLQMDPYIGEIHIGRAARIPQENTGKVSRVQVAQLKGAPA